MSILTGKTAIITGGGRGLGSSIARAFAGEGAAVTVIDLDEPACQRVRVTIESSGARCLAIRCDVANRTEVDRAVAATTTTFGSVDILVNAAFSNPSFNTPFEAQTEQALMANLNSSPGVGSSWHQHQFDQPGRMDASI